MVEINTKNALTRKAGEKPPEVLNVKISVQNLNFFYGDKQALFDVTMDIPERRVTAL
ncbi:MAG: phosphate ABC transporter ATP-binding protein, partial [Planctomycetota bacterium]